MLLHGFLAVLDIRRSFLGMSAAMPVCLSFSMAATAIFAANLSASSWAFIYVVPPRLKRLSDNCARTVFLAALARIQS
jgi:hypothetical protein